MAIRVVEFSNRVHIYRACVRNLDVSQRRRESGYVFGLVKNGSISNPKNAKRGTHINFSPNL